jgi:hypothetical protein
LLHLGDVLKGVSRSSMSLGSMTTVRFIPRSAADRSPKIGAGIVLLVDSVTIHSRSLSAQIIYKGVVDEDTRYATPLQVAT